MKTPFERKPRRPRDRRDAAFTMVELMIVVGIISVLISLLLPAVQSAREVARRTQCVNNLMQIGVGLESYASAHRVYPPGVVDEQGPVTNAVEGYRFSWLASLLPNLDSRNVFNHLNFAHPAWADENRSATGVQLSTLVCPSDGNSPTSSYVGCHHDVEKPIDADDHGVFFLNSRVARRDLVDGPAFTILVGEARGPGAFGSWAMGNAATLRNAGWRINAEDSREVVLQKAAPRGFDPVVLQAMMEAGELNADVVGGFASRHPFCANFLFGDGSVRALKSKLAPPILQALAHRSDGTLVDADAF